MQMLIYLKKKKKISGRWKRWNWTGEVKKNAEFLPKQKWIWFEYSVLAAPLALGCPRPSSTSVGAAGCRCPHVAVLCLPFPTGLSVEPGQRDEAAENCSYFSRCLQSMQPCRPIPSPREGQIPAAVPWMEAWSPRGCSLQFLWSSGICSTLAASARGLYHFSIFSPQRISVGPWAFT